MSTTSFALRGANTLLNCSEGQFDGHAHVFRTSLPMAEGRRYTPSTDALTDTYIGLLRSADLDGGLLVQPSFLGTNNSFLLQTLRENNSNDTVLLKGVVTVTPDTDAEVFRELDSAGIIGLRLNLFGIDTDRHFDAEQWQNVLKLSAQFGWHVDLHCEGHALPGILTSVLRYAERVTVDHFGLPEPGNPFACPGQAAIFAAPRERVFVKASAPYRVLPTEEPNVAAKRCTPIFRRLIEHLGPDQMLWGSDWPWTRFESGQTYAGTCAWQRMWLNSTQTDGPFRVAGTAHAPVGSNPN